MELNSKHFFLTSSQEMQELMRPLKESFGITTFIYKKHFNDGTDIRLSNHALCTDNFYKGQFYKESLFETQPSLYRKSRVLWDDVYDRDSYAYSNSRALDMDYGISFIEPFSEGCEFFAFSVPVGRMDLMTRYLSHLDLIEKFILYFREIASPLIKTAEQHKILIPGKHAVAPTQFLTYQKNAFDRDSFIQELTQSSHKIFSAREIQCAELLLQGYTAKMIAQQLNLSPRTIESYILNLKQKTKSFSKADLIKCLAVYWK